MLENKELQFTCQKCGDHKLSYRKYVKCVMPVTIKNDNSLEYGLSIIDEDDYLATLNSFACGACGSLVEHCGIRMETEKQFIYYLSMDSEVRNKEQSEYDELIDAQIYAQEQKEKELENMSAIDESN
ncbi:MAG: hypothetical protein FVQ82_10395 [Planctomycetes bacterium]|nr:hypothetical protein [Planctomycetota bacterium]